MCLFMVAIQSTYIIGAWLGIFSLLLMMDNAYYAHSLLFYHNLLIAEGVKIL